MKKKYIKLLDDLRKMFSDDQNSLDMITFIKKKVEDLQFPEEVKISTREEKYPLEEIVKDDGRHFAVFSDGACRGNPGPGAWGAIGQAGDGYVLFESSGVEMLTTNNKMELKGATESLRSLIDYFHEEEIENTISDAIVILYSDSKYVVDGMTKWINGWKRNGWKKSDKKPVENMDLWQELDEVSQNFQRIEYKWVKGHSGHPQNERCDQLANEALNEAGL